MAPVSSAHLSLAFLCGVGVTVFVNKFFGIRVPESEQSGEPDFVDVSAGRLDIKVNDFSQSIHLKGRNE